MEPSISLQSHIFNHIQNVTYRDINLYNPLNITHPPSEKDFFFIDDLAKSAVGDDKPNSINIIVPQDCGGFNLGSFFIKRSEFSERLLDLWWDPVGYEQKHMEWEHKEQDSLVFTLSPLF
jgi:mannan polymerase II complex MNN10 subunit